MDNVQHTVAQTAEAVTNAIGDGPFWLLFAFGVTFHPLEWLGGLFFAFACAMLTRHWFPETSRKELWITLVTAFVVSTLGAQIYDWKYPDHPIPIQATMAILGLASRALGTLLMTIIFRTETRSVELADKIINKTLPGGEQ